MSLPIEHELSKKFFFAINSLKIKVFFFFFFQGKHLMYAKLVNYYLKQEDKVRNVYEFHTNETFLSD